MALQTALNEQYAEYMKTCINWNMWTIANVYLIIHLLHICVLFI